MATFLTPKLLPSSNQFGLLLYIYVLKPRRGNGGVFWANLSVTRYIVLVGIVCLLFQAGKQATPLPPRFFSCTVLEAGLWLVLDLVLAAVRDVLGIQNHIFVLCADFGCLNQGLGVSLWGN